MVCGRIYITLAIIQKHIGQEPERGAISLPIERAGHLISPTARFKTYKHPLIE